MKYKYIAVVGLILFLAGALQAAEQREALVLYKEPLFEFERHRPSDCDALYDIKAGKNVPDIRDFRQYFCEGRYTVTLSGNKGTTLSLFGQFKYQKEAGFMVIVKNDNRKLWVINLDDIPSGKWITVKAGRQTGGYEVFFRKASRFDQNISSVKWGQWWQGDTPE